MQLLKCLAILISLGAAAFAQPLSVPTVLDFGNVPVEGGNITVAHDMRVFAVANITNDIVTILSITVPQVTILPDILQFDLYSDPSPLTYKLAANQTRYYAVAFNGTDTGQYNTTAKIVYRISSGIEDSVEFPIIVHAYNSPTPFLTAFQAGTIFLCPANTVPPEAGGWVALFNPSVAPLIVDSIECSGDTLDYTITYIRTTDSLKVLHNVVPPFTIRSLGYQAQFGILFTPSAIGSHGDTMKIYTSSDVDGVKIYQTVLGGDAQYSQHLTAMGEFDNIVYTNVPPDSCDHSEQLEVTNCGDTAQVIFTMIGQRRMEFSLVGKADSTVLFPGQEEYVNVQFCPQAARPWEYDSVMIIATYPSGERDTVYVQIYSSVQNNTSVVETPLSSKLGVYPNPFNSTTHIRLQRQGFDVQRVSIFDMIGREVKVLASSPPDVSDDMEWSPSEQHLPIGTYILVVRTAINVRTWILVHV